MIAVKAGGAENGTLLEEGYYNEFSEPVNWIDINNLNHNDETSIINRSPIKITKTRHTTPALIRTGKILSWAANSDVEGWELQHSTVSNFTLGVTTIQLDATTTSYTIPNNLYYTASGYRHWRIRAKRNQLGIFKTNTSTTAYSFEKNNPGTCICTCFCQMSIFMKLQHTMSQNGQTL